MAENSGIHKDLAVDVSSDTEWPSDSEVYNDEDFIFRDERVSSQYPRLDIAPDFRHQSFDLERPGFRLMRLLPGSGNLIQCVVFQVWFDERENAITYEALSYTWGDSKDLQVILVNGARFFVTKNLWSTLRYLRLERSDRVLWVDAVCIDQENYREKGHQVKQMGEIYSQANSVIFWLGDPTPETNFLMTSLMRLQQASTQEACNEWPVNDKRWGILWRKTSQLLRVDAPPAVDSDDRRWQLQWREVARSLPNHIGHTSAIDCLRQALFDLFSRPWWKRVWVLQEVAKAKAAVVTCGALSISARIFALAPFIIGGTQTDRCEAVLQIMPGRSRKDSWFGQNHDLWTLMRKFPDSQASEPRDLVYVLAGISSDSWVHTDLHLDYSMAEADIIWKVLKYWFPGVSSKLIFEILVKCGMERPTLPEFVSNVQTLEKHAAKLIAQHASREALEQYLKTHSPNSMKLKSLFIAASGNKEYGKGNTALLLEYHEAHPELKCDISKFFESIIYHQDYPIHENKLSIARMILDYQLKHGKDFNIAMCPIFESGDGYDSPRLLCALIDSQPKVKLTPRNFQLIISRFSPPTVSHILHTRGAEINLTTSDFEYVLAQSGRDDWKDEILVTLLKNVSKDSVYFPEIMEILSGETCSGFRMVFGWFFMHQIDTFDFDGPKDMFPLETLDWKTLKECMCEREGIYSLIESIFRQVILDELQWACDEQWIDAHTFAVLQRVAQERVTITHAYIEDIWGLFNGSGPAAKLPKIEDGFRYDNDMQRYLRRLLRKRWSNPCSTSPYRGRVMYYFESNRLLTRNLRPGDIKWSQESIQ